jgi:hypothetical protein
MAKRRESAIFFCRRKDRVLVVYKEFPDFPVIPPKKRRSLRILCYCLLQGFGKIYKNRIRYKHPLLESPTTISPLRSDVEPRKWRNTRATPRDCQGLVLFIGRSKPIAFQDIPWTSRDWPDQRPLSRSAGSGESQKYTKIHAISCAPTDCVGFFCSRHTC